MIRIVTRARLGRLTAEAEEARGRAAQIREQADAAFAAHLRVVFELTGRAEKAEASAARVAQEFRQQLAARAERIAALSAELEAVALVRVVVLLVRYGQPHSIHSSVEAAKACAVAQGARPDGWQPCSAAPPASSPWATIAFTFDDARQAFMSTVEPSLPVSGGAG